MPVFVKILKNNKKLVQSYREHERIREIMAQYFTDNGYKLQQDKHLDLCAHKGKRSIIVEVKSCRADNIDAQIRAGVAQLYYYSYIYEHKLGNSRLCLALSGKPSDDMIHYIRDHCGIDLAFVVSGRTVYLKT